MPLRAKILPQQQQQAQMSSSSQPNNAPSLKPQPGDEPEDVVFQSLYGLRTVQLNRPKKLNALSGSMIRKIAPRLQEWAKSDMANVIVIKGTGEKAFCAGGDVTALAKLNKQSREGWRKSLEYFGLEYFLDHMIATYSKPYVAFMDGITMGGGVGLSVHAPLRIATERTVFAMPETDIGFFPDVGGSFFLPRLPGEVGTYLGLTSERLTGVNVFYSGIATHYLHSTSLPALESRLAELRFEDWMPLDQRRQIVNDTIEEYCTGLPHNEHMVIAGHRREAIDRCFKHNSIYDIIDALEQEKVQTGWAQQTLVALRQRSPTSLQVTLRQMRLGRNWSIEETFRREYQMAAKFMQEHDFTEGVTTSLIEKKKNEKGEKTRPDWKPNTLDEIHPDDDITAPYFTKQPDVENLHLTQTDVNYRKYPYNFGVPTEQDVEDLVTTQKIARGEIVDYFLEKRRWKQGVKEVVQDIVNRKVINGKDSKAEWVY